MPLHLISNDVASDRRRARVSATLEDHGVRVQYSVFEVESDARGPARLLGKLRDQLDQTTDSVRVYPLCQRCRGGVVVIGRTRSPSDPDDVLVV